MINGGELLALIPARAGSERLPGKNSAVIAGKPLIAWSVKAALESKYVDRVMWFQPRTTIQQQLAQISRCRSTV